MESLQKGTLLTRHPGALLPAIQTTAPTTMVMMNRVLRTHEGGKKGGQPRVGGVGRRERLLLRARREATHPPTMSDNINERSSFLLVLPVATAIAEKTSGAPLPNASSVTPATSGRRRSNSDR